MIVVVPIPSAAPVGLETLQTRETFAISGGGGLDGVYMVSRYTDSVPLPAGKILVTNLVTGQVFALNPDALVYPVAVVMSVPV